MKTLQSNFTTPEQSKKLLELGVPANSADCYYYLAGNTVYIDGSMPRYFIKEKVYTELKEWYDIKHDGSRYRLIPCWSVGRLLEIYNICRGQFPYTYNIGTIIKDIENELKYFDFSKLEE